MPNSNKQTEKSGICFKIGAAFLRILTRESELVGVCYGYKEKSGAYNRQYFLYLLFCGYIYFLEILYFLHSPFFN